MDLPILGSIAVLMFSVILHEIAHGLVAFRLGDPTAKMAGRLTLNPIRHIDLFGTIIFPGILILMGGPVLGWAKPVPINPIYFRNERWGIFATSIAGVGTNFILAIISGLLIRVIVMTAAGGAVTHGLVEFLVLIAIINIALGVFNLLPIPPLDGFKVFTTLCNVPRRFIYTVEALGLMSFFILWMLLFLTPVGRGISIVIKKLFEIITGGVG
ncbi:MAG: site-2 protease family protein [Planctomycetes bacterium]|nr:site-2 protease family protein [Planctomycetota bacterium]